MPLAELLETATGYHTMAEHDAKVLALEEQHFGLGQGRRSFAVVTADVGVGAALVVDYRLWRGAWDEAGELGHMALPLVRRQCVCGKTGCLETVAGSEGILQSIREAGLRNVEDIETAADFARRGDKVTRMAFRRAGKILGFGLSWLANLMNLELVVVRVGPELRATDEYERQARRFFHKAASTTWPKSVNWCSRAATSSSGLGAPARWRSSCYTRPPGSWVTGSSSGPAARTTARRAALGRRRATGRRAPS